MPLYLVFPVDRGAGETACMARKRRPKARPKARQRSAQRPGAEVRKPRTWSQVISAEPPGDQLLLMHMAEADLADAVDPLHGVDPLGRLREALELVGIDPVQEVQAGLPSSRRAGITAKARTGHADLVALAVAHARQARWVAKQKPATDREVRELSDKLRDAVLATLYLQHNIEPPSRITDDRQPLIMDGEVITLVRPGDDARSALVTVKLPQLVIDRLRDAVRAMAPTRTMAGIAALGITLVLDLLEAEHLRLTGQGFPKGAGKVLEGGRPSRTRATTAAPGRPIKNPRKPGKKL